MIVHSTLDTRFRVDRLLLDVRRLAFLFSGRERGGYILSLSEPPSTHTRRIGSVPKRVLGTISQLALRLSPLVSRLTAYSAVLQVRFSGLWNRLILRRTLAHPPSMAKSVIMLALGVAIINIFLLSNDAILAAPNDPWNNYTDVNPAQSKEAIAQVAKYVPIIHQADAQAVSLALTASGSGDFVAKPADGQQVTEATHLNQTYTVVEGDTMSSIADKFQLHTASILAANEIPPDPAVINTIKPGDKLTIPPSDISDSNDWLVAINDAAQKEADAAAAAAAAAAKKQQAAAPVSRSGSSAASTVSGSHPHSGTYTYGYCTDLVAALRPDLPSNLGNANTWVARARAQGYATGKTPAKNAAVQLAEGWVGHVALVTSVNADSITIIERNYAGWNVDDYRTIPIGSGEIVGYIY